MTEKVEIDKTVIHRRDDQVRSAVGSARQFGIPARRVDDHKIGAIERLSKDLFEQLQFGFGILLGQGGTVVGKQQIGRLGQGDLGGLDPDLAVHEKPRRRLLA